MSHLIGAAVTPVQAFCTGAICGLLGATLLWWWVRRGNQDPPL